MELLGILQRLEELAKEYATTAKECANNYEHFCNITENILGDLRYTANGSVYDPQSLLQNLQIDFDSWCKKNPRKISAYLHQIFQQDFVKLAALMRTYEKHFFIRDLEDRYSKFIVKNTDIEKYIKRLVYRLNAFNK